VGSLELAGWWGRSGWRSWVESSEDWRALGSEKEEAPSAAEWAVVVEQEAGRTQRLG